MANDFGELLQRLRKQAGLTQEGLANRAELSVETIRGLETGKRHNPRTGTVRALVKGLELEGPERDSFIAAAAGHKSPEPEPDPPGSGEPTLPDHLVKAARRLEAEVRTRWETEEEHQKVQSPHPLPVRWGSMPLEHMDSWENIRRSRPGEAAEPLDLTGRLEEIVDFYRRIPSGRLVVLGRAGAGKTTLTLRFVLQMLENRAPSAPVPVIFSLESWNPTTMNLRDWLIAHLLRDHPGLSTALDPGGPTLAASLVNGGLILPVLDGFDEVADALHDNVLEALNKSRMPLLLTSRPTEYERAVKGTNVLTAAAGIELADLTLGDLNDYFPRTTPKTMNGFPLWTPILDELRAEPRSESGELLAAVLTTPLMVYLARTIYSDNGGRQTNGRDNGGRDPSELLDIEKFPDAEAVEAHLLGSLIPTVYRIPGIRRYPLEDVQHWLGYLAHHMNRLGTHDLAWWQLGASMRRRTRMIIIALVVTPVVALVDIVVEGLLLVEVDRNVVMAATALGLVVGAAFGLAHGIITGPGRRPIEPSRIRMRIRDEKTRAWQDAAHRFRTGLTAGLVVGLGYSVISWTFTAVVYDLDPALAFLNGLINAALFGLIYGLSAGLTIATMALWEAPLDTESVASPGDLIHANRTTTLIQVLLFGPIFAVLVPIIGWLAVALLQQLPDSLGLVFVWEFLFALVVGLIAGIGGTIAYVLSLTAWGQWLMFARIWLPLTGRLPWGVPAFLEDAYHRGVLRRAGEVYRFRHERLQDHLANAYRSSRN